MVNDPNTTAMVFALAELLINKGILDKEDVLRELDDFKYLFFSGAQPIEKEVNAALEYIKEMGDYE